MNTVLYVLWGGLYIIAIVLGFITEELGEVAGVVRVLLMVLGASVFVPPAVLMYRDRESLVAVRRVRVISIVSLCATMVLMVLNVLSVMWSQFVGDFLHFLLAVVSAPMACMQYRWLGLFGWACLLMTTFVLFPVKKHKK